MIWSINREIGRKSIHVAILLALFLYIAIERTYGQLTALFSLVGLLIIFMVFEWIRLDLNFNFKYFSALIRPKEQHRMCGVIFFLVATIICLSVFDIRIAFAAILMATFGDLAASFFGQKYGTARLFKNKTSIGLIAGSVTNLIVGIFLLVPHYSLIIPVSMAICASLIETYTEEIDDNLLVPIIAGFIGQILTYIF